METQHDSEGGSASSKLSTPRPDPTALTTVALHHEISTLKELFETRLNAMDKALTIFQDNLTRAPTEVDKQIGHLKSLTQETFKTMDEKYTSVQIQFRERDARMDQQAKDSKVAVDAALSAQKEAAAATNASNAAAIAKSEAAFTKQIDATSELIRSTSQGWERQFSDMKERLTRIESEYVGRTKEVAVQQTTSSHTLSIIALVAGVIGIIIGAAVRFMT